MKRHLTHFLVVAAVSCGAGFWLGRGSHEADRTESIEKISKIVSSELKDAQPGGYMFGFYPAWIDPDDPLRYRWGSIIPHNIMELSARIHELPEYKKPRSGWGWIMFLDIGKNRAHGLFFGIQVNDRDGRTRRYMFPYDQEELAFAREVLLAEELREGGLPSENQQAEQAGAGQPATKPADKPSEKDQPSPPTSKDAP